MSEITMRAKLQVMNVVHHSDDYEELSMSAVSKPAYEGDGADEDNTYARFSPSASFSISIANPALIGKFAVGDRFYVDFTPAAK